MAIAKARLRVQPVHSIVPSYVGISKASWNLSAIYEWLARGKRQALNQARAKQRAARAAAAATRKKREEAVGDDFWDSPEKPQTRATRTAYLSARSHFAKGEHAQVVIYLDKVIRWLGARKRRFMPMLATSLTAQRRYVRARGEVLRYFQLLRPQDRALQEYADMEALKKKLTPLAASQTAAYAKTRGVDLKAYRDYLSRYPNGPWAADVRRRLPAQQSANKDDQAYRNAQATRSITGYQRYLRGFPNGKHRAEAMAHVAQFRRKEAARQRAQAKLVTCISDYW